MNQRLLSAEVMELEEFGPLLLMISEMSRQATTSDLMDESDAGIELSTRTHPMPHIASLRYKEFLQ